jgi:hypothetical protein
MKIDITKHITMAEIYLIAAFLMVITLAMNTWSLIEKWHFMIVPDKISGAVGLTFTGLWIYFFYFLFKTAKGPQITPKPQESDEDMLNLLKNMEKEDQNAKNQ